MKKLILCIMLITVVSSGLILAKENEEIKVVLDGKKVEFDVEPVIIDGRTLVPIRFVAESMGCDVTWIADSRTVDIKSSKNLGVNPKYIDYVSEKDIIRDTKSLGGVYSKYFTKYIQYKVPNGKYINIVAQDKVTDEQVLKAYNILSFYLTDYGKYNKAEVANRMADSGAVLVMPNGADGESNIPEEALEGQPLYQLETPTIGSEWYIRNDYEYRDAAYEEILHMVHDYGIGIQSNKGALPELQKEIYAATMNSLPENKKDWGKKGLWGLDSKDWLKELAVEGSLEQEYLASVVDSYFGLWEAFTENKGGMWGVYTSKGREDVKVNDPKGYKIVNEFIGDDLTFMARVVPEFVGEFKMYYDSKELYTHKSKYLKNVRLVGNKNTNLAANDRDNILIGNKGNNKIDGKDGYDVVQFEGNSSDYDITKNNDTIIVEDKFGRDGIDTLVNIEILRFKDEDIKIN